MAQQVRELMTQAPLMVDVNDTLTQAAKILPAEQFDAELMRLSEQAASSS